MNINKLINGIPKVDLHCHLDGSVRPSTMIDIAIKDNISLPTYDKNLLKKYICVFGKCHSLKEYLDKFKIPIAVMQNYDNIYRITLELLEDSAKQNIRYIEIRFAPFNHTSNLSANDVIKAALEARKYALKKYGIMSNLILCAMRHEPPETSIKLVNMAKNFVGIGVVAVDLAGNEEDFPPEIHKMAFKMAKYYGLHCTIHAGETGNPQNIIKAIKLLGAERIGHGVSASKNRYVVEYLRSHNIPLEMCITSNVNTSAVDSYESHPIKSYLDYGLLVTANTDNITVSNTTIINELNLLVKYQNFTSDDIKKIVKNGIQSSFLEKVDKENLYSEFINFIKG